MLPFFYRCLQILLEQGAAVNTATQSGDTPLHLAVDGGHLVCCQLLLHHGADIILPGAVSQLQLMRDGRSGSLVMLTLEAIQWQILLFRMFLMLLSQFHPFLTFSAQIFDWTPENKLHPTDTPEFLNFLFHIVIPADKKRLLSQLCSDLSYDIHSFLLKGEPFLPFLTVSLSVFPGFVQTLSSEGTKCTCLRTFSAFLFTTLLPNACMLPSSKPTSSTKPG